MPAACSGLLCCRELGRGAIPGTRGRDDSPYTFDSLILLNLLLK